MNRDRALPLFPLPPLQSSMSNPASAYRHWFAAPTAAFLLIIGCQAALALDLIGTPAPSFVLTDGDGKTCALADLRGKPVLLFFGDESERSQKGFSELAGITDYYLGSELNIIALALNKNAAQAAEYQETLWLTYPLYGDADSKLAEAFGVTQGPQVVFLDRQHVIRHEVAYRDEASLKKTLFGLMDEKVIVVTGRKFEYEPSHITVNKGDKVLIKLLAEDVTHGMFIDGYEKYVKGYLNRDGEVIEPEKADDHIKPGELGLLRFVADKSGRFTMRCASTCGEFHPYMIGYLTVKSNLRYYWGIFLAVIFGIGSLWLTLRAKDNSLDKLFGIIPLGFRYELTRFKFIRALFKSRWIPLIAIIINTAIFTIIILAFFVGGFSSAGNYNFGIMIVWILWYSLLMMFMVPFVGRLWCMVCPFPLIGDWFQRGKLFNVGRQKSRGLKKKWPAKWRNLWPLVILFFVSTWFSGFFTVRPMASFIFVGAVVLLAIIIALIYEKRTFCLFVCPVSGFQGLYANFSACEVRVKDPEICKKHTPKTCFVGSEKGYGCPWMEMPYDMNRNTYCGLCLECFKTCPYDNMAFNVRPFGADFMAPRRRTDDVYRRRGTDEAFKALTMLGIFFSFFIAFQGRWGGVKDQIRAAKTWGWGEGGFLNYLTEAALVDFLIIPGTFLLFAFLSKLVSRSKEVKLKNVFVNFSYCLVPIGIAVWAAFSFAIILPNGSYILHILSDPFAWGWNLFGTADFPWTPFLTGLMPYMQTVVLLIGLLFALDYGFKFSRQTYSSLAEAKRGWIPILCYLTLITIGFLWLFLV